MLFTFLYIIYIYIYIYSICLSNIIFYIYTSHLVVVPDGETIMTEVMIEATMTVTITVDHTGEPLCLFISSPPSLSFSVSTSPSLFS